MKPIMERPRQRLPNIRTIGALEGGIDVCRTGTWRDSSKREVVVTDAMLYGPVAVYREQDPMLVVVGLPTKNAPADTRVEAPRKGSNRPQVELRDIAPACGEVDEANTYADRSIAVRDGLVRRLGFLDGVTPSVPGLAPMQFTA